MIIQEFLSLLKGVKQSGDQYSALCPAHNDNTQSLSVSEKDGKIVIHCHRGCSAQQIVDAMGLNLRDLFSDNARAQSAATTTGITVEQLAADKGLPVDFISHYVKPWRSVLNIVYKKANGQPADRQRIRTELSGKKGSKWTSGAGKPIIYGAWRVSRMVEESNSLVLVEGESDSWTCWYHKIPALGVPGANMCDKVNKTHVEPFANVYVWKEPDSGGETFVAGAIKRLAKLKYAGNVFIIQGPADPDNDDLPVKDLNQLHKNTMDKPGLFKEILQGIFNAAEPVELPIAPRKSTLPSSAFKTLTDVGNAERLTGQHGENILFCHTWNKWLIWNKNHWEKDSSGEIYRLAMDTARSIYVEAANETDQERQAELAKHAHGSQARYKIKAMVETAADMRPVLPAQLDASQWLFNVQNGTLNLRTGELQPHNRDDLITKISPASYSLTAQAPVWERFLDRVTNGDRELIAFLQRAAGYALTGDTSEHCLFFLHGDGRNGKSVFLEALKFVMGDYGRTARPDVLMAKRQGDAIPNEVAALDGVRYVSTTEADSGKRFAEAMLKQATGGDTISARFMRAEFFEFEPQFKIFLASNHKPIIKGQDTAIWERIYLIPFTAYIPPAERDKKLGEKLRAEAPGILRWAMEGCLEWQRAGLQPPTVVRAATDEYKNEMDALTEFLADRCSLRHDATTTNAALWSAYENWCRENGEKYPLSRADFNANLKRRNLKQLRKGVRYWSGIGLLSDIEGEQARLDECPSGGRLYDFKPQKDEVLY